MEMHSSFKQLAADCVERSATSLLLSPTPSVLYDQVAILKRRYTLHGSITSSLQLLYSAIMSFYGLLKSLLYSVAEADVTRVSKVQRLTLGKLTSRPRIVLFLCLEKS
jgi:hypothetical protein